MYRKNNGNSGNGDGNMNGDEYELVNLINYSTDATIDVFFCLVVADPG